MLGVCALCHMVIAPLNIRLWKVWSDNQHLSGCLFVCSAVHPFSSGGTPFGLNHHDHPLSPNGHLPRCPWHNNTHQVPCPPSMSPCPIITHFLSCHDGWVVDLQWHVQCMWLPQAHVITWRIQSSFVVRCMDFNSHWNFGPLIVHSYLNIWRGWPTDLVCSFCQH